MHLYNPSNQTVRYYFYIYNKEQTNILLPTWWLSMTSPPRASW